ncbi:MAG: site-specific DNA-methyltransferase [Candidatus Pacearchaeota archaeon]|jgi:DNA modification methylase
MNLNNIYQVDVLEGLKKLPDNSIDCIVTSPPYWALRDYGVEGQLGLESNPQDYINKIVEIMKECKRIIKPTGTIWLNIGDSYYSRTIRLNRKINLKSDWLQTKQKLLTPYRIAIKCQDELGLILRNDINWVKQIWNCKTKDSQGSSMPSSVRDRLNTTSESIFFFVKDQKYFFDLDNIRIPLKSSTIKRANYHSNMKHTYNPKGKNPGDCIMFPLEPSKEEHIAMFPKSLPEFCIKAGCPELVCKKCGTPRLTITIGGSSNAFNFRVRDVKQGRLKSTDRKASTKEVKNYNEKEYISKKQKKLILGCSCNSGFKPGVVLDPFMGSGTTALVCKKLNRNFIGFELNPKYIQLANRRLENEK